MELIYFFISFEYSIHNGIFNKVNNQVLNLRKEGINARIVLIQLRPIDFINNHWTDTFFITNYRKQSIYSNFVTICKIRRIFRDVLKKLHNNDVFYFRGFGIPIFVYPLNFLTGKFKCLFISEHQTFELNEFRLSKKYGSYILELLFGKIIRKKINGFVSVTDEISTYQSKKIQNVKKPHITIGNGVDIKSLSIRQINFFNSFQINMLCIANINRWHGLDRLIKGIALYHGFKKVTVHIVGTGPELQKLKQMVLDHNLFEQVIFHGFTTGAALDNLFNTCHIAVGSLGIHRKGLTQTSELKVREYCARGIPWIIACRDPDFPDDFPYIHRIPADESPVNIEEVIEFVKRVYADPDHPQKMREYALEHLDWSVKMKKLKTFLESLVDESPPEA